MKKKHILTSIALTLLLSFMLLSCNADATAGLFRQISEAKAPVGIEYKQIVGIDSSSSPKVLYFLTDEGLYKKDGTGSSRLVANTEENIIATAHLDGSTSIAYQVNTNANDGYKVIKTTDVTGVAGPSYDFTAFDSVKLLPNGLVLTEDADTFALYDYTDENTVVTTIGNQVGYDINSVVQVTGKEHVDPTTSIPMLVSLVNSSGDYKHFYIDGTGAATPLDSSTTDSLEFIALAVDGTNIYAIAIDSDENIALYKATSSTASFTNIYDTSETFSMHAFMYAKTVGTDLKLITKPSGINDALYVLSISSTGTVVSASDKTDGYGEYLDAVEIVDSYEMINGTLLVATLENGMYSIDVLGDDSSDSEEYTL
ncbi:hypothetical protein [uncultured Sphaerochaeta sp.]|uniref:hypothetical protein n=1 Tax=uncultured Sphaerochaeta sp. TaxID=886478 RepID=UPI002AA801A6|nr:hypothetical protein [uncultured Sphaerochaeta sp.]